MAVQWGDGQAHDVERSGKAAPSGVRAGAPPRRVEGAGPGGPVGFGVLQQARWSLPRLWAVAIRAHSLVAASRPRRRNRR